MNDIENRKDIENLVDTFYARAREHEELGPIFNNEIGNLWFLHLDTMYRFWTTLLLDEREYSGSPFPKHVKLPIEDHHFDQWLTLFHKTVDDLYAGEKANLAKQKAHILAVTFRSKLQHIREAAAS